MTGPSNPDTARSLNADGPLSRDEAAALLDRGAELLSAGEFGQAFTHYRRVIGFDDPEVTAAALLGAAQSRYRMDDEAGAVATWEAILELPETPTTYHAWREIAAARVRDGDLQGAIAAYREADRRAPIADKAEIANRLGWLAKETGNVRASRRYFARGRGSVLPLATYAIIGITVAISLTATLSTDGSLITDALALVGLGDAVRHNPYDLGFSRRKLLAMASVLAMGTSTVVLDEPTTGQDARGVDRVRAIVRALAAEGRTVIAISHDMRFVVEAFPRLVVMRAGRIVLDGTPEEVFAESEWPVLASTFLEPTLAARVGAERGMGSTPTEASLIATLQGQGGSA